MDVIATLDADCTPDQLLPWVRTLDRYPAWLSIVPRAEAEPVPAEAVTCGGAIDGEDVGHPAWAVELRAKLGPLARSKRLRMVRTLDEPDHVRFERWELDGREHSPWVLDARLEALDATRTRLTMSLHYGGNLGVGVLEKLLRDEIEASKPRLKALAES